MKIINELKIGQKILCVDNSIHPTCHTTKPFQMPVIGGTYTIKQFAVCPVTGRLAVRLEELNFKYDDGTVLAYGIEHFVW